MDRIIKKQREKQAEPDSTLMKVLTENRNVYVWGPPGTGKTWSVCSLVSPLVHLDPEVLRTKQGTLDFLERCRISGVRILLDDYDSVTDYIGIRELSDQDSVIRIGNQEYKFDQDVYCYRYPTKSLTELRRIASIYGINSDDILVKSQGDIRYIINGPTDERDVFWTPKDFVKSLICKGGKRDANNFIGHQIEEHGHVFDMIHDNYIDGQSDPCEVLECLSRATVIDERIYEGNWHLMPYFSVESCIRPAILLNHTVPGPEIRPGSMWTKFQNMCMRAKKVDCMCRRVPGRTLDIDSLMLLRDLFEKGQGHELIQEYKLEPQDFDVLNHLCLVRKLKPKVVTALKKKCLS